MIISLFLSVCSSGHWYHLNWISCLTFVPLNGSHGNEFPYDNLWLQQILMIIEIQVSKINSCMLLPFVKPLDVGWCSANHCRTLFWPQNLLHCKSNSKTHNNIFLCKQFQCNLWPLLSGIVHPKNSKMAATPFIKRGGLGILTMYLSKDNAKQLCHNSGVTNQRLNLICLTTFSSYYFR